MKQNKIMRILILSLIICICLLVTIIIILFKKNSDIDNPKVSDENVAEEIKYIEKKINYNEFYYPKITTSSLMNIYFTDYINKTLQDQKSAYEQLDKNYKDKRFGNIQNYNQYLEDRIDILKTAKLDKYYETKYDDYTQYTMIDQYGNYYIFKVTAVLQYTIILDSYTVKLEETIERYGESTNEQKAAMNVQTFTEMINTKDYTAAYNVLADGFKQNYFKDEDSFKKLAKSLFFECNKIKSVSAQKKDNYYVITATLQDYRDLNKELKPINFVVNLKDDMQFELSFGSTE